VAIASALHRQSRLRRSNRQIPTVKRFAAWMSAASPSPHSVRNRSHARLGTVSLMIQVIFRAMFTFDLSGVLFSTSPPLIGFAATIVRMFRLVPIAYWAMDLNPDQLIGSADFSRDHAGHVLETANRMILRNATLIIALDRFMAIAC